MSSNPLIKKIAKILALAEDQAGKPEGELAAKLAAKMMRAHAISMAEVGGVNLDSDPMVVDEIAVGRVTWRSKLAWTLAIHCNCTALRAKIRKNLSGSQSAKIQLYGHKTDVEVCQYLYEICEKQIEKALKVWKKDRKSRGMTNRYGICQAYRESAVLGLSVKLAEIRAAGKKEDPKGTAMVISRAQKSEDYMNEITGGRSGIYRGRSRSGFNTAGFEAGKNISLHKGVKGNKSKNIQ